VAKGERNAKKILAVVQDVIENTTLTKIDYVKLCNPDTLEYIEDGELKGKTLLALAVFVGGTRLIDNAILEV